MNQFIKFLVEAFDFDILNENESLFDFNIAHNKDMSDDESLESLLDRYLKGDGQDLTDDILKTNAPIIYAFTTPYVPDAIKIGYTDLGAYKRLTQWERKYGKGKVKLVGYWTSREFNQLAKYVFFKDFPVHRKVIDRGHYNLTEADFEKLRKQLNLSELHVSREFFRKINDKTHNDKDILSREIIAEIIRQMKEEIKAGNADFTLYELLEDGTVSHADNIMLKINNFGETPLQAECIKKGVNAINAGKTDLLMAAVMRFGKTFTTYLIIKQTGLKYVLITSAKADTRTAWRNEISHVDFIDDFCFIEFDGPTNFLISEKDPKDGKIHTNSRLDPTLLAKKLLPDKEGYRANNQTVIIYATLLDLSGKSEKITNDFDYNITDKVNVIKNKHKYLFENLPDMIVVDETHYGSHASKFGKPLGLSKDIDYEDVMIDADTEEAEKEHKELLDKIKAINPKITLQCSGTPYYILASGEFSDEYQLKEIICDVSFTDMIEARDKWVEENEKKSPKDRLDESKSPYFGIPNIYKFGMHLTKECERALLNADIKHKMSALFKINKVTNKFVHENAIKNLMISLYGDSTKSSIGFINTKKIEDGEIFKHTIIVLPEYKACKNLKELLINEKIIDENKREVIVAVTPNSTNYQYPVKDSNQLNEHMKKLESDGKRSLILTVYRFLTGVTLPLVDSMLFMRDTELSLDYDLAVFRLCSRNIATAKDSEGNEIKVNRKNNVYLIDFNIARMFKLTYDSAIKLAGAKGITEIKDIKKYIEESLDAIPAYTDSVFDEHGNDILKGMHQVTAVDFLKEYVKFNNQRSIELNIFDKFNRNSVFNYSISKAENIELLNGYSQEEFGFRKIPQPDGTDDIPVDPSTNMPVKTKKISKGKGAGSNKKDDSLEVLKKKFMNMMRTVLYCNLCFDMPALDFNEFTLKLEKNKELLEDFKLDIPNLKKIYLNMSNIEKMEYNSLIYLLYLMANEEILKPVDRIINSINKLGKISDNEFVTPEKLVNKMINKLDITDIKNAKSILLVNEKYGEFFIGLYRKFKEDISILKKCKIVPSSAMTKHFCKKVVKQLGLSDDIILNIGDIDGNGKYDIADFLSMKNEELLKINNGMKFDICLMNPPYGDKNTGDGFYVKFLNKCTEIINTNLISVNPDTAICGHLSGSIAKSEFKKIRDFIDNHYIEIELINKNIFDAGIKSNICIININFDNSPNIIYNKFGKITEFKKLKDINNYFDNNYLVEFEKKLKKYILKTNDYLEKHIKLTTGYNDFTKAKLKENNPDKTSLYIYLLKPNASYPYAAYGSKNGFNTVKKYSEEDLKVSAAYINFNNNEILQANNALKYIQSDFVLLCVKLATISNIGNVNRYTIVPWLDFSKSYTEDDLFNLIGMKYNRDEILYILKNIF